MSSSSRDHGYPCHPVRSGVGPVGQAARAVQPAHESCQVMYSGLKLGACPRGSNRRAFGSPCLRPIDIPAGPRGCMRNEHVAAHPQVYSPIRQGVRATRARRSRDSLALSLSLREPMQEGCTVPVTPKLPSTVRRFPTATLAWVPLASGALHLLVPRTAWRVKSPPRRSRGPSAKADPIPLRAKARSLLGFFFVNPASASQEECPPIVP